MEFAVAQGFSTWEFLLAMNLLLLIIGCFLEVVSTLLLVMPILAPVLVPLGVDPVHFGIIFTHNMEVGLVHPPVGLNLFVLSTISDAPMGEVIRGILPFLVLLLIVLGLITYWPAMTLWLAEIRHTERTALQPAEDVEKVLGKVGEGDVTVACWEPGQVSPNHLHPNATEIYFQGGGTMRTDRDRGAQARQLHRASSRRAARIHQQPATTLLFRVRYGDDMSTRSKE